MVPRRAAAQRHRQGAQARAEGDREGAEVKPGLLLLLAACCLALLAGGCDSSDGDREPTGPADQASGEGNSGSDTDNTSGTDSGSADASAAGEKRGGSTLTIPSPPGGKRARRRLAALGNACLLARGPRPGPPPPTVVKGLAGYARETLPRAAATAEILRRVEAPPSSRQAVRGLRAEYVNLLRLLPRSALDAGVRADVLLPQVQNAVSAVNGRAVAAGIPICGIR